MLTRLLAAAGGSGSFLDVGYSMSADEITFWQDQAALLDPLAYEFVSGTSQTRTVSGGETWYLVSGWKLQGPSSTSIFHRLSTISDALPLTAGTSLVTDGSSAGSHMLLCKPSLVTGSDTGGPGGSNRYAGDPRALYFDRIAQLGTATQYTIGATATSNTNVTATFPSDFTYGLVMHASAHDVAWVGLEDSGATLTMNLMNEISDADPIRFAQSIVLPFTRATFPKMKTLGVSLSTGSAALRYLKLPGGW